MTTRRLQPPPDEDFRGLSPGYLRDLADEAFVLGIALILISIPAILLPIVWRPAGWFFIPPGLIGLYMAANCLRFSSRAWENSDQSPRRRRPLP